MTKIVLPELLSPAGNPEKLLFAYLYGADACYVGGENFSLRRAADNFTDAELADGIKLAHSMGRRLYVAVNIFAHNEDIEAIADYLRQLADIKPDGLIVSDPGVFSLCKKHAPEIPIHISTQANNTNWATAQFWKEQGAKRLILARELTLAEAGEISRCGGVATEIFIHGAMCVSYSGRCLLSNFLTGRDANKGNCSHPCRWEYRVLEEKSRHGEYFPIEEDEKGAYIMNSKDLCLLPSLPEIVACGISSLKIEGRNKSAYYAANVTRIYRAALDAIAAEGEAYYMRPEWMEELQKVSHREYTEGFAHGKPDASTMRYENSGYEREQDFCAIVLGVDSRGLLMEQRNKITLGDELEIILPNGSNNTVIINEMYDYLSDKQIESAPHPKQKIIIPADLKTETPLIARRKSR